MELPARTLKDAFNACNPTEPLAAGDQRYVSLAPARGAEGGAVSQCKQRILWSEEPFVQLFGGHRGCGKSTELRRLQKELEDEGYFVVYIDADVDIDFEDTQPPDILLALIRNLDSRLREAGIPVDSKLLDEFVGWFAEVVLETTARKAIEAEVRSEAEVKGGVPLFARLLARFTGWIKTGTESKKRIRQRLDPQLSQLLDRGRWLVEAARLAVRKEGKKDLVILMDSLDRVSFKALDHGRSSHEFLFIDRGELLKGFRCHLVLTVPISLLFSPKVANLNALFPDRHLLPMVKIRERWNRKPSDVGLGLLRDLLTRRVVLEVLFEESALEQLIAASGGHPRHLMTLLRYAFDFVETPPVTGDTAGKAVQRMVNDYGRSIPDHHWPLLAEVYESQQVRNDADHQLMLYNLSVLEYQNDDRWCDVHPAIEPLAPFQQARKALRRKGK